jgi:lysophospholipase L1-like esterase
MRKERVIFVATIAAVVWAIVRVLYTLVDLIGQINTFGDPPLTIFRWLDLSGIFILSIVFLVTVFRKKRVAVSIAVWLAIFELLHMGRKTLADHPLTILAVLAWIGIAVFLAKTLPKPAVKKKESWITGVWITLGMLLVLEAACDIIIHNKYPLLRIYEYPSMAQPPRYDSNRPTLATIGSSPANLERIHRTPFSAILAKRFEGRANFVYFEAGGLASNHLLEITKRRFATLDHLDALLLYIGHQDLNAHKEFRLAGNTTINGELSGSVFQVLFNQSNFIRMSLYVIWSQRYDHTYVVTDKIIEEVFSRYAANMDEIVKVAQSHKAHVFVATVSADKRVLSKQSKTYMDMENAHIRGLAERFPNVTLIDFEPKLDAMYPDGPDADCQPYEPLPYSSGCGDPFHLGIKGHEILADMLEPEIEKWLQGLEQKDE